MNPSGTSKSAGFPGIFVTTAKGQDLAETISAMDKAMHEWTMQAARGECGWVCADCCCSFSAGMPDECAHGHQSCTDIIKRDKLAARTAPDQPTKDSA